MRLFLTTAALAVTLTGHAAAQQQPSMRPVDRIYRLEQQVAAGQSVTAAQANRIVNLENQLIEAQRQLQQSTARVSTLESELSQLRSDMEARLGRSEAGNVAPRAATTTGDAPTPAKTGDVEADGEAAYDAGYQLWQQKKYDQAVTALRAMASSFPNHRRVSWANNLAGRALLDSGQPRAAAEALLANYRGNPKGERAPDSLFYLGQALVALKQPTQACKAYAELEEVYGSKMRDDLQKMLPGAKAKAGCK